MDHGTALRMVSLVPVVKIKLGKFEVLTILRILGEALQIAQKENVRVETLILAEFYLSWYKRSLSYELPGHQHQIKQQTIPLSVARVLHYRLRFEPATAHTQSILSNLDQILVNMGRRPDYPITIN
ncbi:hypothetical protein DYBT9275_00933 [Dyadobacter sp. CECT 9275]|uniref:Uncharacterized protein n=1 Tax=Dyadobacter helix TaxID=2822344 RepID=A0A916J9J6_9BACT|nr:hypothetical protein [Dyadobacter sp. CECT 9275]CAG4992296.1 hypothetical protein DYBT9275_00933 [Dyadobacter sp. CECT 9275]